MNYQDGKDIYVYIEHRNQTVEPVAYELISEAKQMLSTRTFTDRVVGVIIGRDIESLAEDAIEHGCDHVIMCEDDILKDYDTETHTHAIETIIKHNHPAIFLIGGTVIGRDLAPRVSARMHTGLTADATHLTFDENDQTSRQLYATRPALGGNLFATIICPDHMPQMSTVRPGVFDKADIETTHQGTIERLAYDGPAPRVEIIETSTPNVQAYDLTKADIIVSAGRGAKDFIDIVESAAQELGACLGSSRALVDEGITLKDCQVGQTGKTVKPTIYIACGISGAIQHTAGMEKSDLIIAINTDEDAPIFNISDIGFIGDAKPVLEAIKKNLSQNR
jgi:electron transfer flavoprotein alpha subunit